MRPLLPLLPLLAGFSLPVAAQGTPPVADFLGAVQDSLNSAGESTVDAAGQSVAPLRSRFIDINYQQPEDSQQNGGWNVKYDLHYAYIADDGFSTESGVATLNTLEARLDISGSYSFGDAVNNQDLSSLKASFAYIGGSFGAVPYVGGRADGSYQQSRAYQLCKGELTPPQDGDREAIEAYALASDLCIAKAAAEDLFAAQGAAYAYEIAVNAGIEGNQDYSEKHNLYGVSAVVSARRWPSLRLDLEQVDASGNEQRLALTDDESYDRVTLEVGYQYSIDAVANLPIVVSAGYRRFHELDAPRDVREAGLESFDYWSVSLRVPARMFRFIQSDDYSLYVRYTDGQLPFDLRSDSAFEVGFSSNIALLARLFQ